MRAIRDRKAKVLAAMPAVKLERVVRGQYGAGMVLGDKVKAYRQEPNVAPLPRWKPTLPSARDRQLAVDRRAILYTYREALVSTIYRDRHLLQAGALCVVQGYARRSMRPNWLVLSIAPVEEISLQFELKRPGSMVDLAAVKMDFRYSDWFPKEPMLDTRH